MNNSPWLDHYDKGVPQTIEVPEAPLYCFLEEAAQKYPDGACTIFKGAVISFREMNALADRMAAALVELGVKKGDRVGIFMPNTPQFVIAYFGILKAGGVVVAVNPTYPPDEVLIPVNDANIEIILEADTVQERVPGLEEPIAPPDQTVPDRPAIRHTDTVVLAEAPVAKRRGLDQKPEIVCLNKCDALTPEVVAERRAMLEEASGRPVRCISGVSRTRISSCVR